MDPAIIAAIVYGIITGTAGIITTIAGIRAAKEKARDDCHKSLMEARKESEELAQRLHDLRMKEMDE